MVNQAFHVLRHVGFSTATTAPAHACLKDHSSVFFFQSKTWAAPSTAPPPPPSAPRCYSPMPLVPSCAVAGRTTPQQTKQSDESDLSTLRTHCAALADTRCGNSSGRTLDETQAENVHKKTHTSARSCWCFFLFFSGSKEQKLFFFLTHVAMSEKGSPEFTRLPKNNRACRSVGRSDGGSHTRGWTRLETLTCHTFQPELLNQQPTFTCHGGVYSCDVYEIIQTLGGVRTLVVTLESGLKRMKNELRG